MIFNNFINILMYTKELNDMFKSNYQLSWNFKVFAFLYDA